MSYLLSFLVPIIGFWSLASEGLASYSLLIFGFLILGIVDLLVGQKTQNKLKAEQEQLAKSKFHKRLLRIMVPVQYTAVLFYFAQLGSEPNLETLIGRTLTLGTLCGVIGINVAHELGHKPNRIDQFCAKALLLTSFYMHFIIEHNRGHHKDVGKAGEPGSANKGESLYAFYFRALRDVFSHAWILERNRLQNKKQRIFSFDNEMLRYLLIQILYAIVLISIFGFKSFLFYFIAAFTGILLLEAINYIEHYGLKRKLIKENIYELVKEEHSWNSNHWFSRMILFELPLHPDHHLNAFKPYQTLNSSSKAPQMPLGYPLMILMALFPPIWFRVMDNRIPENN